MKRLGLLAIGLTLGGASALAQSVSNVWIQHYNLPANQIQHPVIKKSPTGDSRADGTSAMVSYSGIQRYDANRLLVGIRENGINEGGTLSAAEQDIVAKYPDMSLIWIDANTGGYLGIAHRLKARPVPMEPEWTAAGGSLDFLFWGWAIDQGAVNQKALYATYNNKIVRYAPKAGGGWEDNPTVAFEEPTPGTAAAAVAAAAGIPLSDSGPWHQWRPSDLKVSGSGPSTEIWVGNKTWRNGQHNQLLRTTDGLNFKPVARLNDRDGARKGGTSGSGSSTRPLKYRQDPDRPNLLTVYEFHYPATGFGPKPSRYNWDPDDATLSKASNREEWGGFWGTSHPWEATGENKPYRAYDPELQTGFFNPSRAASNDYPAWDWDQGPEDHQGSQYDGFWGQILEGHEDLDYLVSYSSPSWNAGMDSFRPAWIAVHSIDGSRARNADGQYAAYKIPVTGADQPEQASPARNPFIAVYGDLEVNKDPVTPGKAEVLWVGRTYGFGRFVVETIPAQLVRSPANTEVIQNRPLTLSASFSGGINRYQWFRNNTPIPGATKPTLTMEFASLTDAGSYKLVARNALGNVESAAATVTVLPDTVPPVPVSAGITTGPGGAILGILFDEVVQTESATTLANYSVPGASVTSASLTPDRRTVRLGLSATPASGAQVTVSGVRDLANNPTAATTRVAAAASPLAQADVGDPLDLPSQSAALSATAYAVEAQGRDIWGNNDSFHYLYRSVSGDFDVAVKIESTTSTDSWARNSIMLRETLAADSYHVSVGATPLDPSRGFYAHFRGPLLLNGDPNDAWNTSFWNNGTPNGPAINAPVPYAALPVWVRLQRQGNKFTAYRSTDGRTWLHFGQVESALASDALLGLATSRVTFTRYADFGTTPVIVDPGPVAVSLSGSNAVLTWTGPGTLESAPSISGPWTAVAGATSPYSTSAASGTLYFRLR
ncbi:MAG: hypothetical protein RL153_533 [Verrucomicrobiota bacterium]